MDSKKLKEMLGASRVVDLGKDFKTLPPNASFQINRYGEIMDGSSNPDQGPPVAGEAPAKELDRKTIYEEARKEKERLEAMAKKNGKLRLDIESDAAKEKSPPILTTEEATKK